MVLLICPRATRASEGSEQVPLCDLVRNPAAYNGLRLSVKAVYSYGYEWQELLCTECRAEGKIWATFQTDAVGRLRRQLNKAPRDQGIVTGKFTGVFHASGGPFGDGTFRFEFVIEQAQQVRVLVRDWKTGLAEVGACKRAK